MNEHTNVIVILSDGTHRTLSFNEKVDFKRVAAGFREITHQIQPVKPAWAFVALGLEHHQYTGSEVEEIAADPRYMDLPREVVQLTNLTCAQIDRALRASGYTDNRLVRAEFRGMSSTGSAHYKVAMDDCGEEIVGDVYVTLEGGERRAEF